MTADQTRCKIDVSGEGRFGWVHPHQCRRKIWKDGFCRQHHPDTVKDRLTEADKRWKVKAKQGRLERYAGVLLRALEELVDRLEADFLVSPSKKQMKQAKAVIKSAKGE